VVTTMNEINNKKMREGKSNDFAESPVGMESVPSFSSALLIRPFRGNSS